MDIKKPPSLAPGSKVGLVCPSSPPVSPMVVSRCAWLCQQVGLVPIAGASVLKTESYLAGPDGERLFDIHAFFSQDDIKAIFCVAGGYGSLRLLDQIDYKLISQNPKIIVGSDDNDSLLLAIHKMTGLVTMHGINLDAIETVDSMQAFINVFLKGEFEPLLSNGCSNDGEQKKQGNLAPRFTYAPVKGQVEGRILAGNLTAITSLMGTRYQPDFHNTILLLEDKNERYDILDRWFTNLHVSGALSQTQGIGFGHFKNCAEINKSLFNVMSLEETFGFRLCQLNKPCCFNLPVGQSIDAATIPIGLKATFNASQGIVQYLERIGSAC